MGLQAAGIPTVYRGVGLRIQVIKSDPPGTALLSGGSREETISLSVFRLAQATANFATWERTQCIGSESVLGYPTEYQWAVTTLHLRRDPTDRTP